MTKPSSTARRFVKRNSLIRCVYVVKLTKCYICDHEFASFRHACPICNARFSGIFAGKRFWLNSDMTEVKRGFPHKVNHLIHELVHYLA